MVKVIESGYLRAEVDMTDIDKPKITISTVQPVVVSEYHSNFDVWHWGGDFAVDACGCQKRRFLGLFVIKGIYIAVGRESARPRGACQLHFTCESCAAQWCAEHWLWSVLQL